MQSPKEQQGEIRKPSTEINAMQRNTGQQWNGKDQRSLQKIRDTKGPFHAKMGKIKERNGMDLTEAESIRRDGKNTQVNYTEEILTTQKTTTV